MTKILKLRTNVFSPCRYIIIFIYPENECVIFLAKPNIFLCFSCNITRPNSKLYIIFKKRMKQKSKQIVICEKNN